MVDDIEVVDNETQSRYEARSEGELAGSLTYRRRSGRISLIHTEVDDRFRGRAIGTRLAVAALDAARAEGLAVLPICPLVADYIDHHPDYQELVAKGYRAPRSSSEGLMRPGTESPGGA